MQCFRTLLFFYERLNYKALLFDRTDIIILSKCFHVTNLSHEKKKLHIFCRNVYIQICLHTFSSQLKRKTYVCNQYCVIDKPISYNIENIWRLILFLKSIAMHFSILYIFQIINEVSNKQIKLKSLIKASLYVIMTRSW